MARHEEVVSLVFTNDFGEDTGGYKDNLAYAATGNDKYC